MTAIRTPTGFDANTIVARASEEYGMAFGGGLGEVAGKVFRIGHLGQLTDALALIVPFYGFVESLARHRGLNPDQPEKLNKVTETL